MTAPPKTIASFEVVQHACFDEPKLPYGYIPPGSGSKPLSPILGLAICQRAPVAGFYLLYCDENWGVVTYAYAETIEHIKRNPWEEFRVSDLEWHND